MKIEWNKNGDRGHTLALVTGRAWYVRLVLFGCGIGATAGLGWHLYWCGRRVV